jgi:hypothetical protein
MSSLLPSPSQGDVLSSSPAQAHQTRADSTPEPLHASFSHLRARPPPHGRVAAAAMAAHPLGSSFPSSSSLLSLGVGVGAGVASSSTESLVSARSLHFDHSLNVPVRRRKLTAHSMDSDDDNVPCPKPADHVAETVPTIGATDDEAVAFPTEEEMALLLAAEEERQCAASEPATTEMHICLPSPPAAVAVGSAVGADLRPRGHSDPSQQSLLDASWSSTQSAPSVLLSPIMAGFSSSPRLRLTSGRPHALSIGSPVAAAAAGAAIDANAKGAEDLPTARARRRDWLRRKSKKLSVVMGSHDASLWSPVEAAPAAQATAAAAAGADPLVHAGIGSSPSAASDDASEEEDGAADALIALVSRGPGARVGGNGSTLVSPAPSSMRLARRRRQNSQSSFSLPNSPPVQQHTRGLPSGAHAAVIHPAHGGGSAPPTATPAARPTTDDASY